MWAQAIVTEWASEIEELKCVCHEIASCLVFVFVTHLVFYPVAQLNTLQGSLTWLEIISMK